jgi:glycine betaine/proline transport system ATP-binding protein
MSMDDETVLQCLDVWKVFGPNAQRLAELCEAEFEQSLACNPVLVPAVREATLSVRRGENFCIMGLSGSGKSTLVRCMTGLLPLSRGKMSVLGLDLGHATEGELIELRRHKIAMVFQDFALLPHLTALENVAFPLRVQGVPRNEREAKARRILALAGLEGREEYYPHELSGGQQQRVGIARSLMTDPELWFLDEPFSALDPLIRQELQDELLRLQALLKKTIVFVTHDFDEAIRLSSRIAIMRDGRIVQIDTPEGLIMRPADDYVARFTQKIALTEVVTVGSVMSEPPSSLGGREAVPAGAFVKDVAERVLSAARALPVVDETGRVVGALGPKAVTDVLLRRTAALRP